MSTTPINTATTSSASAISAPQSAGNPGAAHFSIMELIAEIAKIDDKLRDTENQYSNEQQLNAFNEQMDSIDAQKDAAEKHKKMGILDAAGSFLSMGVSGALMGLDRSAEQGFKRFKKPDVQALKKFNLTDGLMTDGVTRRAHKKGQVKLAEAVSNEHLKMTSLSPTLEMKQYLTPEVVKSDFYKEHGRHLEAPRHRKLNGLTSHAEIYGRVGEAGTKIGSNSVACGASSDERLADFDKSIEKYFDKDSDSYSQKARSVSSEMRQAINSLVQIEGKLCDAVNIR